MAITASRWTLLGDGYYRWLDPMLAIVKIPDAPDILESHGKGTTRRDTIGISVEIVLKFKPDGLKGECLKTYNQTVSFCMTRGIKYEDVTREMFESHLKRVLVSCKRRATRLCSGDKYEYSYARFLDETERILRERKEAEVAEEG